MTSEYLLFKERCNKEALLKHLPVAACMVNRQGVIEYANDAYATLLGSTSSHMVDKPLEIFTEDAARNVKNDFVTFDRGGVVPDHELYVKDTIYWVNVRPIFDDNGVAQALIACLTNINALKSLENKIQQTPEAVPAVEGFAKDGLTQLERRDAFYATLELQLHKMFSKKRPLSLILLEVDEFQSYRQQEGDDNANQLLTQITDIIKHIGGEQLNLLYRYDQDQFSIILPNVQLKEAAIMAEQIRKKLYDAAFPNPHSPYQRITVSMGVYTENAVISYMRIVNGADNALYLARKNGKNRIEIY